MADERDSKKAANAGGQPPPPGASYHTPGPIPTGLIPINEATAQRLKKIAEAAYRRAQERNFAPGHDLHDWLEAEREIDGK